MSCFDTPPDTECGTYEEAAAKPKPTFRRVRVFAHDRDALLLALTQPDERMTRGGRKRLHAARAFRLVPIDPQEPKSFPVKFALKLTTLRLTQLIRQQKKRAREASTAKHILAKMDPSPGRLRTAMTQRQDDSLARLGQVTAEIKARALACEGRLAAAE